MLWMAYGERGECRHRRKNSCVACNKVKRLHEEFDKFEEFDFYNKQRRTKMDFI